MRVHLLTATRCTYNLGGNPSKYYPGPTFLDYGDQMGTGMIIVLFRYLLSKTVLLLVSQASGFSSQAQNSRK
jgi:hypothetical protein